MRIRVFVGEVTLPVLKPNHCVLSKDMAVGEVSNSKLVHQHTVVSELRSIILLELHTSI